MQQNLEGVLRSIIQHVETLGARPEVKVTRDGVRVELSTGLYRSAIRTRLDLSWTRLRSCKIDAILHEVDSTFSLLLTVADSNAISDQEVSWIQ